METVPNNKQEMMVSIKFPVFFCLLSGWINRLKNRGGRGYMDNYFHLWMHVWYSSFYSGESMAKSLISFEVDRQFRGLSRAVVRGNLVMWNFSSSLSLKYMWNHLWCTGEKIVYRLLIKGFLRETIKEKARGWTASQDCLPTLHYVSPSLVVRPLSSCSVD